MQVRAVAVAAAGGTLRLALAGLSAHRHTDERRSEAALGDPLFVPQDWRQEKAKASKLEHSSTRPAAVTARNPSDTKS